MTGGPAMTTAEALGAIPEFVHANFGERGFIYCLEQSRLPALILNARDGYFPEISVNRFIDAAARVAGDALIGLQFAKFLTVHDYGLWGTYILSAPTLGAALHRAISTIGFHASTDALCVAEHGEEVRFQYYFGERGRPGYLNVAIAAAGVMLSVPRHFLGARWTPHRIAIDVSKTWSDTPFCDVFKCPVIFDHDCIEIVFDRALLSSKQSNPASANVITRNDLWREYQGGPPLSFHDLVASEIQRRLGSEDINSETIAMDIGLSTRTLRRRMDSEGTSFREILQVAKLDRARELLTEGGMSITEVALYLGYNSPSHFTRAFKSTTGVSPIVFKRSVHGIERK